MFFMLVALAWEEAGSAGRTKSLPVFGKCVNSAHFLSSLLSLFSVSLLPRLCFFSLSACWQFVLMRTTSTTLLPLNWLYNDYFTMVSETTSPNHPFLSCFCHKHSAQITQLPRGRAHMSLEPVPLTSRPRKASGVQPHLVDGHGTMLLQLLILTIQVLHEVFDDPLCFDGCSVVFLEI